MLAALNQLLTRSVVDPAVRQAYDLKQTEPLLVDCGFEPEMARRLSKLEAASMAAYLLTVYELVHAELERSAAPHHPWPADGLSAGPAPVAGAKNEAA
ncbi:MAG TPA: hypothetical protein VGA52_03645 [Anaerolineales bacterium]|jgi:hypothetical protein